MSTSLLTDSVQTSSLYSLVSKLRALGVHKFSCDGLSLELYPDAGDGMVPSIEPQNPDAHEAARDAITRARELLEQENKEYEKDLLWST
jgi:hypothetical protein